MKLRLACHPAREKQRQEDHQVLRSSLVYAVCSRPAKATKQDPVSTAKQEQRDEREAREGEREKRREADFPFHLTERQRPTWRQSSHRACEASAWRAAPRPHTHTRTHTHTNCLLSSLVSGLRLCTDSLESPLCCKFCSSRATHETDRAVTSSSHCCWQNPKPGCAALSASLQPSLCLVFSHT